MRFKELFDEGNERYLKELIIKYYQLRNVYADKQQEPPPDEMSQKLHLHPEEYSELLNFISAGGFQDIIDMEIDNDIRNGAIFLDNII
jgi:hypothetical protein